MNRKIISPRPDLVRKNWVILNGEWDFEFDDNNVGINEKWYMKNSFCNKIRVPFCYQSKESGIGETKAHEVLWYLKVVKIPLEFADKNLWLQFGAVDYEAIVWINDQYACNHKGGHTPFSLRIDDYLNGDATLKIVTRAYDPYDINIPRGKQHWEEEPDRCWYTSTSGIWQDVWLEAIPGTRIDKIKITPDIDQKNAKVVMVFDEVKCNSSLNWYLKYKEKLIRKGSISVNDTSLCFTIDVLEEDPIDNLIHLWSQDTPNLYDLDLELISNEIIQDEVSTYFGMRKIEVRGDKILLNYQPLFQKLLLDQGYWEDTLLTPLNDEAIIEDIKLVKDMGFNGVRKHQKIEVPKFYYYADIMGLLVWSEMPSNYRFSNEGMKCIIDEWIEIIERDYNHPCIITWVPFNESWGIRNILNNKKQQSFALSVYNLTKAYDDTRIVSTNDGWEMLTADICSIHDYEAVGERFFDKYKNKGEVLSWESAGKMLYCDGYNYEGQPIIISEFGGVAFEDGDNKSWGYNGKVDDADQFINRVRGLVMAINKLGYTSGYCYTQLTDVGQEKNGLLFADRTPKVELEKIRDIFKE